ncbi:MAG: WD40 repeat domain-containing protein [Gammaproteobacteria bacterium]|nr:WD40 repeat domain-containing protein [Gammaproteobacteria bacterium]
MLKILRERIDSFRGKASSDTENKNAAADSPGEKEDKTVKPPPVSEKTDKLPEDPQGELRIGISEQLAREISLAAQGGDNKIVVRRCELSSEQIEEYSVSEQDKECRNGQNPIEVTRNIWNVRKALKVFEGHSSWLKHAGFSRDGKRAATASADNSARIWNVETGKEMLAIDKHKDWVTRAVFSPGNDKHLITVSLDETAWLWEIVKEKLTPLFPLSGMENAWINHAAFSTDGQHIVTACGDNVARLWDVSAKKRIQVFAGHEGEVNYAVFSPDSLRVVTASKDKTARVWDTATGKLVALLEGHHGEVNRASFSPDGQRVVTASTDNSARLWDVTDSEPHAVLLTGHEGNVWLADFSPDEHGQQVVTASRDKTARLWDAHAGTLIAVLRHWDNVWHAGFAPAVDGQIRRVVTASSDNTARLWDADTGMPLVMFAGHKEQVGYAAFSRDGKHVITASRDNTARLWDAGTRVRWYILE